MKDINKIPPSGYRIPLGLKEWLKERADKNLRSMNCELILLLREAKEREEDARQTDRQYQ
ncbi:Arc family DNA-binding protein [Crenobacter cavernae]|uniref:Arc family DNA-binding protein n=1 Tax=Crenobacter cavernae TaxID=2290923 RepID=A0ABY0FB70_9NEIS|nr:Arc family DNA-binding protein [Crenobacter cavernae]RXZ42700.1 Arc family DNA-binding protein [Crenobacter cavernae]